ncbi:FAD-dependent oxidoreductase, partial [Candidatus Sumerlaeota bacterium]|nr:FAD-dependent oxidoreductase [Candidatus Sumerlaeota bacterium]
GMWTTPDEELIRLGSEELERIGLGRKEDVTDGTVVRMPKAYPIYDDHYKDHVHTVAQWLKSMDNLASAGRNAMHQYNNQDHSMMAAMISARNILRTDDRDPWNVNHNAEYLEERRTPQRLSADPEVVEVS